jgi:hypothetical protein
VKAEEKPVGIYTVEWNGEGDMGQRASSGIYFFRLQTRKLSDTRRVVLIK